LPGDLSPGTFFEKVDSLYFIQTQVVFIEKQLATLPLLKYNQHISF